MLTKLNSSLGLEEPSEELIESLVLNEMINQMPTGPYWFSETALRTGEIGKLLEALAKEITKWIYLIKSSKNGIFISNAKDSFLDRWGRDTGILRQEGETDEAFRFRIKKTLILSRVTKRSIEEVIFDSTKLEIDYSFDPVQVIEPWTYQERKSKRHPQNSNSIDLFYGRSGQTKRTGSDRQTNYSVTELNQNGLVYYPEIIKQCYYQGGVIDVVTPGFSSKTWNIVYEMIAAGIKPFFTAAIKYKINNPNLASLEAAQAKVQSDSNVDYETGGNFIARSIVTRSGPPVGVDEFSLLADKRLDIIGLDGKSGNKTVFKDRNVEYILNEGNLIGSIPSDFPFVGPGDVLYVDSFPAFRSTFRKELSPRSGAVGDLSLAYALGWKADTFLEFAKGSVRDTREVLYSVLSKFSLSPSNNSIRSASTRSGSTNPYHNTELHNSEPLGVSLATSIQLEGEVYQFALIGSLKSIFSVSLFPRSGALGESSVLSPIDLPLSSELITFENVEAIIFTELTYPLLKETFEESLFQEVSRNTISYENLLKGFTTLIGTTEEAENIQTDILEKTWEQLANVTWEQASALGEYNQLAPEVIISS